LGHPCLAASETTKRDVGTFFPAARAGGSAEAALRVARFRPKDIAPQVWAVVAPLARDAVAKANPADDRDATELMSRTAALLVWCNSQGLELRPEVVFHPDTLDRFIATAYGHLASGTGTNYRRILRRVGRATLGPPLYPPRPLSLRKSDPNQPYSRDDERAVRGWVRGLSTSRLREGAISLVGMGLGAGLRSKEIEAADSSWIKEDGSGLVVIVPGSRRRRVPVAARWEWELRRAVELSGGGLLFRPSPGRRKRVSVFTESLPANHPKLSVQRLRVTWIVRHLDARVPLHVLADAAGVTGEQLSLYAGCMADVPAVEVDRLLRGERR
jgi:hypothetical protein